MLAFQCLSSVLYNLHPGFYYAALVIAVIWHGRIWEGYKTDTPEGRRFQTVHRVSNILIQTTQLLARGNNNSSIDNRRRHVSVLVHTCGGKWLRMASDSRVAKHQSFPSQFSVYKLSLSPSLLLSFSSLYHRIYTRFSPKYYSNSQAPGQPSDSGVIEYYNMTHREQLQQLYSCCHGPSELGPYPNGMISQ
jgi:hypothetical protein